MPLDNCNNVSASMVVYTMSIAQIGTSKIPINRCTCAFKQDSFDVISEGS